MFRVWTFDNFRRTSEGRLELLWPIVGLLGLAILLQKVLRLSAVLTRAGLAVNTVHMFANICSRSLFANTVRN